MRRSCQEFKEIGHTSDGDYLIDPDGLGAGEEPITVYCYNMTANNGLNGTHVRYDSEEKSYVKGYEALFSYFKTIRYNMTMAQMIALGNLSPNCEQSRLLFHRTYCDFAAWELQDDGIKLKYLGGGGGGGSPGSGKCACDMTKSYDKAGVGCNCDVNNVVWQSV